MTLLSAAVETIRFHRTKYGRPLLVDACAIADVPGFITTPRAHRLNFYEIALVTAGRGRLALDGALLELEPGRVFVTAPGEVRSWRIDDAAAFDGRLALFEPAFVDGFLLDQRFLRELPVLAAAAGRRGFRTDPRRFDQLVRMVEEMGGELRDMREDSCHALRAQTYRLLVALQRAAEGGCAAPAVREERSGPEHALFERFRRLLDEGVSATTSVSACAGRLRVSPRRLNECLHARTGLSAHKLIDERLMLEAGRLLLHTSMPVAKIAESLQFADASYFGRFFRRHAGTPPAAFRRAHGSTSGSPDRPL